ncbi:lysophospholipid acyltransferase family protein [Paraflavisolibacter sp. H34]|uniref:lysophospholipid acyltransferase family protein n=1 Tax=Huijunlia imazamoxiresistens TaxID=3127457 RepID=UPI003016938B
MKVVLKPLQWLYCLYALLCFIVLMVPVFLFAVPASFAGRIRGGDLIYKACIFWADAWFALVFIRHRNIYEQPLQKDASYIFVANHISYLDAAIIPKVVRKPLRPLGKAELGKVPVFGFIYKRAIVSVDRSSAANRAKSVQVLKSILRKGISVLVFPEGTFNLTRQPLKDFYDGAFRIAIETGTPIKPVLFLDTYDRMHYKSIFSLTPGRNRCIFLEEVNTQGFTLKDVGLLRDQVFCQMEAKLQQYRASWIQE